MQRMQRSHIATFVVVLLLLCGGTAVAQNIPIRINEINEEKQWVELQNTADSTFDVSSLWLCNLATGEDPFYNQIRNLNAREGSKKIPGGGFVVIDWNLITNGDGEIGLYVDGEGAGGNAFSYFGNSANIRDYVRWGNPPEGRADEAVEAGIWPSVDSSTTSAQSGATIAFLGTDPDSPSDWGEGNPTPGESNVVIPVELTAFDAVVEGSNVLLTWTTASETNNAGFEVQHRKEGTFKKVGFVEGTGTTAKPQSYQFRLQELSPGHHAFRLKQIDIDGSSEFSPTVEVTIRARAVTNLRPNPTASTARFTLSVRTSQAVNVEVYDMLGRHVRTIFEGELSAGRVRDLVVNGDRLSSGTYFVRIAGEQFRDTRKLVVTK